MHDDPLEGMTDDERRAALKVTRQLCGVHVSVYDASDPDGQLLYSLDAASIEPSWENVEWGVDMFNVAGDPPKFVLAHLKIGEFEFWVNVHGTTDVNNRQRRYRLALP